MIYLLLVCQFVLAIVLLLAATGKIFNAEQFFAALRLSRTPNILVMPIALLIPALEICLAVVILLSPSPFLPLIMALTGCLLGTFTLWMISVYARGLRLKCGCFGTATSDIGLQTIFRNMLLIAVALVGFVLSMLKTQSPLQTLSLWMVITVFSLGMCLLLVHAFRQGRTALILSPAQLLRIQEQARSDPKIQP